MKNTILLFVLTIVSFAAKAQLGGWNNAADTIPGGAITLSFYPNQLDTFGCILDSSHIWQIGKSHKTDFDTAYGAMTDTLNPYRAKSNAYMQIKMPVNSAQYGFCNYLAFEHKYQVDSLHAKCYLTVSYDSGHTWTNICFDYRAALKVSEHFYYDTAQNQSDTCFKGTLNGWTTTKIMWQWELAAKPLHLGNNRWPVPNTMYVRFNFHSDSTSNTKNRAGWCIRNITLGSGSIDNGSGVQDITTLSIKTYPNPCTDAEYIDLRKLPVGTVAQLQVNDMLGRTVYINTTPQGYVTIDTHTWAQGVYILKLITTSGKTYTDKITKQ